MDSKEIIEIKMKSDWNTLQNLVSQGANVKDILQASTKYQYICRLYMLAGGK